MSRPRKRWIDGIRTRKEEKLSEISRKRGIARLYKEAYQLTDNSVYLAGGVVRTKECETPGLHWAVLSVEVVNF